MNLLSLFSGIGGIDLAAEWAGIRTVAFCERDPFCQKVLRKHWPTTRIFDDVRQLTSRELPERIDIVAGGYPCQPFSLAGRRSGHADERHLWPEMFRLVQEIKPSWVVGENVKGHVTLGLDEVLNDLEGEGYEARAVVLPALAVGAEHIRERCFVVAYAGSERRQQDAGSALAHEGKNEGREANQDHQFAGNGEGRGRRDFWQIEPGVRRIINGVPSQLDRLRALGNAVVPQQAYPIFAAIAETHNVEGNRLAAHETKQER